MGLGIPPLRINIMLESIPLKSIILVRRLGVRGGSFRVALLQLVQQSGTVMPKLIRQNKYHKHEQETQIATRTPKHDKNKYAAVMPQIQRVRGVLMWFAVYCMLAIAGTAGGFVRVNGGSAGDVLPCTW